MTDVLPSKAGSGPRPLDQVVPEPDEYRYPFRIPFGWFQIAWSEEVKPGDVLPRFYFGRHLVLWRDHHGQAHVNDAFCPHLGGHFGYGGKVVNECQLQCPFHGWEFDAEGANTNIPYSERTNNKASVRPYPVREIGDHIIAVWFHPEGAEPLYELDIPTEMTDPNYGAWTDKHFSVKAAAQELAENSVDGPHFRYVHNTEIVPEIESYESDGYVARMRSVQQFPTPRGVVDGLSLIHI